MQPIDLFEKLKVHAALVVLQLGFAGFEILTRNLLIDGFSPFVFPVYRNAIAFLVLAPLAYWLERNERPKLEWAQLPMFLCLGTIGILGNQISYILGLRYTSASFTSAYRNSMPVFTFLISYFIGIERVKLRTREGQAKILGTTFGVTGALIMSLYRGAEIIRPPSPGNRLLHGFHFSSWNLGVVILTAAFLSFAIFLILQAQLMKTFPAPLSIASISIGIGCIELAILALMIDRNFSRWKLNSTSATITVVYAGVVASGLVSAIQSWGVKRCGPVTVAAYQPLETVAVAVLSFLFLREGFRLGSMVGAAIVVSGLYLLIWGQSKEKKDNSLQKPLLRKDSAAEAA
ncbi:protein WALLS ARE THIN 1 isoform X2 [Selaginella moellendorffii]|uniref:protein WALLS ARE THIN 1 isoform X2 n=1 Tax=Selaginella moellendorffii TaxID=88036 RepID=UPI000D1C3207|nr:protein WALLS ARE THIN 1 isoform X2 [Selaginella moellendorffii]|eukprot:XP_024530185.1 protein WALLS ARE THIN 1 isoform X2 [Selaginella moellendorffii]